MCMSLRSSFADTAAKGILGHPVPGVNLNVLVPQPVANKLEVGYADFGGESVLKEHVLSEIVNASYGAGIWQDPASTEADPTAATMDGVHPTMSRCSSKNITASLVAPTSTTRSLSLAQVSKQVAREKSKISPLYEEWAHMMMQETVTRINERQAQQKRKPRQVERQEEPSSSDRDRPKIADATRPEPFVIVEVASTSKANVAVLGSSEEQRDHEVHSPEIRVLQKEFPPSPSALARAEKNERRLKFLQGFSRPELRKLEEDARLSHLLEKTGDSPVIPSSTRIGAEGKKRNSCSGEDFEDSNVDLGRCAETFLKADKKSHARPMAITGITKSSLPVAADLAEKPSIAEKHGNTGYDAGRMSQSRQTQLHHDAERQGARLMKDLLSANPRLGNSAGAPSTDELELSTVRERNVPAPLTTAALADAPSGPVSATSSPAVTDRGTAAERSFLFGGNNDTETDESMSLLLNSPK
ncbi:unnamed protein product [Amoebophrya sp. A25]|nr:unnamed protein product [Amoebophrya sp. A25]|eukprot:GSA25T00009957001.1